MSDVNLATVSPGTRCPEGHLAEDLYYRRIPETTDTIISCRKCDQG